MKFSFKNLICSMLILVIIAVTSALLWYKKMSQAADYMTTRDRLGELNMSFSSYGRGVKSSQLERIKQRAVKLRINSKITASSFAELLQIENRNELYRDSLDRDLFIIPNKIDIFENTMSIYFVACSEPFRLNEPSLLKFELFNYRRTEVRGYVCLRVAN